MELLKLSIVIWICARSTKGQSDTSFTLFKNIGIDDVIFSGSLLFEKAARSKSECANFCCENTRCLTFTFTSSLTLKSCRGHFAVMTAASNKTVKAGSKTYTRKDSSAQQAVVTTEPPSPYVCEANLTHCGDVAKMTAGGCSITPSNGLYKMTVGTSTVDVYCDQVTDKGGWMVFLRRKDGSVNFQKNWTSYKAGFGDPAGEFWLGLETLYKITSSGNYLLRIDMKRDPDNVACFANFTHIAVNAETDKYRLIIWALQSGSCGDQLGAHSNCQFSTADNDNDGDSSTVWATQHWGGFWYKQDTTANPTGCWNCGQPPSSMFWGHSNSPWATRCNFIEYKIKKA